MDGWMGGGVAAGWFKYDTYNLQILYQQSNYFTIYECKNVMDVIALQH